MNILTAIKLLFQMKNPVTGVINDLKTIKSGWNTMTWWTTLLLALVTLAGTLSNFIPAMYGLAITTGLTLLYQVLRMAQTAGQPGAPTAILLSTKFWMGVMGLVSAALISLKNGGIDPKWVETAIGAIGTVMTAAQSVTAAQPENVPGTPPAPTVTK